MIPEKKFSGPCQDKSGKPIGVGDPVKVLIVCDGYQHRRVVDQDRQPPFEGSVVGFSGADQVVIEDAGIRYSAPYQYVESLKFEPAQAEPAQADEAK